MYLAFCRPLLCVAFLHYFSIRIKTLYEQIKKQKPDLVYKACKWNFKGHNSCLIKMCSSFAFITSEIKANFEIFYKSHKHKRLNRRYPF